MYTGMSQHRVRPAVDTRRGVRCGPWSCRLPVAPAVSRPDSGEAPPSDAPQGATVCIPEHVFPARGVFFSLGFFFLFVDLFYSDCQSYRKHIDRYKVTEESPVTQLPRHSHD